MRYSEIVSLQIRRCQLKQPIVVHFSVNLCVMKTFVMLFNSPFLCFFVLAPWLFRNSIRVSQVPKCRPRQGRKQTVKEEEELFFLSSSFKEKKKSASKVFTVATGVFSILHSGQLVGQLQSNSSGRREDNNRCFFSELLSSLKTKLKS
jgi:hypothetical protein